MLEGMQHILYGPNTSAEGRNTLVAWVNYIWIIRSASLGVHFLAEDYGCYEMAVVSKLPTAARLPLKSWNRSID